MRVHHALHTQLDNVANDTHYQEAHADCLADFCELSSVGYNRSSALALKVLFIMLGLFLSRLLVLRIALRVVVVCARSEMRTARRQGSLTLCATCQLLARAASALSQKHETYG